LRHLYLKISFELRAFLKLPIPSFLLSEFPFVERLIQKRLILSALIFTCSSSVMSIWKPEHPEWICQQKTSSGKSSFLALPAFPKRPTGMPPYFILHFSTMMVL
jgi:hypothetical protein